MQARDQLDDVHTVTVKRPGPGVPWCLLSADRLTAKGPPLAAALILAPAAGVAVRVSHPLCVTFIKGKDLSLDEGGWPVRTQARSCCQAGRRITGRGLFLAVTVTAAGGHVRLVFNCVWQVMSVHQMKLAPVRARCSYPLFISGPGAVQR
jgi:hypothetical protein